MKSESGITIVILVTTIIILLILAGVSLRQTFVNNASTLELVTNETEYQTNMIQNENKKMNSVISDMEKEWGIS